MKKYKGSIAITLLIGFVAFFTFQAKPEPQIDCNFVMSSQMQRVSWKTNLPIHLYITAGIPQELRESIRVAAAEWNYKLNKEAIEIYESDNVPTTPAQDGISGIYWMTTWNPQKKDEQARTTIHWFGDNINEADILVNAQDHEFSAFSQLDPSKIDFTSLMVHEMGHALGLQHIQGVTSVMNPTLALDTPRAVPFDIDVKSLKCEYN